MMKTATDFSQQVRKCEKAIRAASAANAELLSATKGTMTMPLPQTYDESNGGLGSATAALNLVGGPSFKADAVSRVGNDSGHKLETEVLAPLTRWQEVHMQLAVSGGGRCEGGACRLPLLLQRGSPRAACRPPCTLSSPPAGPLQGVGEHPAGAGLPAQDRLRARLQVSFCHRGDSCRPPSCLSPACALPVLPAACL